MIGELETECKSKPNFPKSLFSLSLLTVANILEGALQKNNDTETSKTEGTGSSETLLHYLRSLKLDKASERLQQLADEAGVNIESGSSLSFSEVAGQILSSYRRTKKLWGNRRVFQRASSQKRNCCTKS